MLDEPHIQLAVVLINPSTSNSSWTNKNPRVIRVVRLHTSDSTSFSTFLSPYEEVVFKNYIAVNRCYIFLRRFHNGYSRNLLTKKKEITSC